MREFYDIWVDHQLRQAGIASSYWVIATTDKERRAVVNEFCEKWIREHGQTEWDPDLCFEDFDQYLEADPCRSLKSSGV